MDHYENHRLHHTTWLSIRHGTILPYRKIGSLHPICFPKIDDYKQTNNESLSDEKLRVDFWASSDHLDQLVKLSIVFNKAFF